MKISNVLEVIQRQLNAYNAKDVEGLLATYAPNAEQWTLNGERLASGHQEIRLRYVERFAEPDLHAQLLSRMVVSEFVVDQELVTRNFPEGLGTIELGEYPLTTRKS